VLERKTNCVGAGDTIERKELLRRWRNNWWYRWL